MINCSTERWKFPLYFHQYHYTYGKCPKSRELKWFPFIFFSRVIILSHSYDHEIADLQTPARPQNIEFWQRIFSGKLRSFNKNWFSRFNWIHYSCCKDPVFCTKTGLVDSTGFITIVVKIQCFVSFTQKPCLLVPFYLTMLNKHLLKQDLVTGKRR